MKAYVFKLNINPKTLAQYSDDFEQLIGQVVPADFDKIFDRKTSKDHLIKYSLKDERQVILDSDEYKNLVKQNQVSKELYQQVEKRYKSSGDIVYSDAYLQNRKEFSELINKVEIKFPVVKASEKIRLKRPFGSFISEIGMNKKYIQKADRIELYVEETLAEKNPSNAFFFYDVKSEYIYISAQTFQEAKDFSESINNVINGNMDHLNIGEVNINNLYEKEGNIEIKDGTYSNIKILKVFPNGSAVNRAEALRQDPIELMKAAESKSEYFASEDGVLDLAAYINAPYVQDNLKKGYENITYRDKSIITTAPRTIEVEDFTDGQSKN